MTQQNKWDKWLRNKIRVYFCNWEIGWLTPSALHRRLNLLYSNTAAWDEYIDFYDCVCTPILQQKSLVDHDIYGTRTVVDMRRYPTQINTNVLQLVVSGYELKRGTSSRSQPLPDDDPRSCRTIPGYGPDPYVPTTTFVVHDDAISLLRYYNEQYGQDNTVVVVANTETSRCYYGVIERLSPEFEVGIGFSNSRNYEIEISVLKEGYIEMAPPQQIFPIISTNSTTDKVTVDGDVTALLPVGSYISLQGTRSDNDGIYSVKSRAVAGGDTEIEVNEGIPTTAGAGGAVYRAKTVDTAGITNLITDLDFYALDSDPMSGSGPFVWRSDR